MECQADWGASLAEGDDVDVKRGYGRATVIAPLQTNSDDPMFNRIHIQYADGTTYWVKPDNLRPVPQTKNRVIVADTTRQYREAALRYTAPQDVCLEVGCHEGVTSAKLQGRCASIVGVDASAETIDEARKKFPHVHFEVIDGFNVAALKALSPTGDFDKIFVDIGGIAELPTVARMVGLYFRTWKKATIIVKSVFLSQLLGSAELYKPSQATLKPSGLPRERKDKRKSCNATTSQAPASEVPEPPAQTTSSSTQAGLAAAACEAQERTAGSSTPTSTPT